MTNDLNKTRPLLKMNFSDVFNLAKTFLSTTRELNLGVNIT